MPAHSGTLSLLSTVCKGLLAECVLQLPRDAELTEPPKLANQEKSCQPVYPALLRPVHHPYPTGYAHNYNFHAHTPLGFFTHIFLALLLYGITYHMILYTLQQ